MDQLVSIDRDTATLALLTVGEPIGERVYARSFGFGNRVATTGAQMDKLSPPGPAVGSSCG